MRNFPATQAYFDAASSVDGWFYPVDMLLFAFMGEIQETSGFAGDLCEVGVWHGKSLALLALMAGPGEQAYGYDRYVLDCTERTRGTLQRFCGSPEAARLVTCDTATCTPDSLRAQMPRPLRFLHVDAGHEYHEALADLQNFGALVGQTGIIAIDDYYDRKFPGVAAAAHAYIEHGKSARFVPFVVGHNKLYLCNPALAGHYQRHLLGKPPFQENLRLQKMYEHTVLIPFADTMTSTAAELLPLIPD